jgi:hypothetical protein
MGLRRRPVTRCGAVLLLTCATTVACAADWELDLDLRLLTSDGQKSALDGGPGALRFGEADSGLQPGRLRFAFTQALGELWAVHVDASSWGDHEKNPIDLTEAFLQYRPYPFDGLRARVKAGAFYAPISLENRAAGWESPYTLSASAINSWVAEELRTVGVEGQLEWLGTRLGHDFDLSLTGAVFGWNDPAGTIMAEHGFMLDDRQSTLFGRVGPPGATSQAPQLFHEIDGRPGVYAGVEARYYDRIVVRALRYDNRADPSAVDATLQEFAWLTRFNSAGVRYEGASGWTAISQWLDGETYIQPGATRLGWPFDAKFLLLSRRFGAHTLSARYDRFQVRFESNGANDSTPQDGHAWTVAYAFTPSARWRFTLEWVSVASASSTRQSYGLPPGMLTERKLELAVRCALGPALE